MRDEITACFDSGCFDTEIGDRFAPLLLPFLVGTRFEGKLNTGEPPKDGALNVYFAKSSLPGRLAALSCNCAYLGYSIIVCDQKFLSSFGSVVDFTRDSFYGDNAAAIWNEEAPIFAQVNKRMTGVLLSWILGHEIGHAVLHDTANYDHRRRLTELEELQADAFFINKAFSAADKQRRQDLYSGLTQFVFAIIGVVYRSENQAAKGSVGAAVIAPSRDNIHPPWLLRALTLGQRLTELDPDTGKSNDFYKSLSKLVLVRNDGIDIGSLCDYENLREAAAHRQYKQLGFSPSQIPHH